MWVLPFLHLIFGFFGKGLRWLEWPDKEKRMRKVHGVPVVVLDDGLPSKTHSIDISGVRQMFSDIVKSVFLLVCQTP